ncbi:MAG: cyclopropane-fatty-acyl-phospholipid synthase family protein [Sulfuritalea sp.]|jgi:cyclopropane-fatty-acyl-phospholipid synthase|nr:cyclopropane-fatty-acyl-phospholipid synthase family protein [Polynucleobacter sp.]MCF8187758.1 cyclopropane-fatty-acyl-phospholipid synthase family protein [Sulfuritalea sp.]
MNKPSSTSFSLKEANSENLAINSKVPAQVQFLLRMLSRLEHGSLKLECPDGKLLKFGNEDPAVTLSLSSWEPFLAAIRSGDIGFAESYLQGEWQTDNLAKLIELFIHNRNALESAIYGSWWGSLLYRIKHLFNRNSRAGSRRNIHAHYDIGNSFYTLWLDPSMTYSSALFAQPEFTLQQAQYAKYERIFSEINGGADSRILEIGCGWGGFAELAAKKGARITGLTLSTEQLDFAQKRLNDAGVSERTELRLQDYRDTDGEYDGIASIEMFEAVGEEYWDSYFACIAKNLKTGGRACIQTITIADDLFERYRKGTDFIQQYIFPGGMLPSPSIFRAHAQRHGLSVVNELAFGLDYARTLRLWDHAFEEALPAVQAQGFDERFIRTWKFYLAYCEAGFRAGSIDLFQFTLQKN